MIPAIVANAQHEISIKNDFLTFINLKFILCLYVLGTRRKTIYQYHKISFYDDELTIMELLLF